MTLILKGVINARFQPSRQKNFKDACSWSLKPNKKKEIKRKQPIPDTPYTKVYKLDPTIQSRMTPAAKTADRGLSGLQGLLRPL